MAKFKHKGIIIEYDEKFINGYTMAKAMSRGADDPSRFYGALEKLYSGRDDEYAEALGYDNDAMLELVRATFDHAGENAKNSSDSQAQS